MIKSILKGYIKQIKTKHFAKIHKKYQAFLAVSVFSEQYVILTTWFVQNINTLM
ncbi:hypothetical protein WCWAEYFT_CDS0207 [Vibrio phage VB_VaC_TDDLMA]